MSHPLTAEAMRRVLERRATGLAGACPDDNTFAAYLEARLPHAESAKFEEHASNCAACAQALGLALRIPEPEVAPAGSAVRESGGRAYSTSPLRFAIASLFVITAGVLLYQSTRTPPASRIGTQAYRSASTGEPGAGKPASAVDFRKTEEALPPVPPPKPRTETARVPESKPLPKAPPASGTVRADVAERANAAQTSAPAQAELQSRAANLMYEKQLAQNLAQANAPAQTATQAAAQQAIDRLSVVEPRPVSAAAQISRAGKKVGGRIFYREGDRWVDADSLGHAGAKVREIKRDSKEFGEMTLKEPALAGIPADAPVLLYWNGEVVLIRQ